ncbi:MAG TPA: 50S ribosomal protein L29 [Bryobacteraceae bacterium]|jgi:large subunit ribosomal protein L29|nr:50S ribosomal protein L29 [Bryobacteraceae bacterium]
MKANKVRDLDNNELGAELRETQETLFRLKFQIGMGQMEGLKKYRALRKDQARILTVQRERELHPELTPEPSKGKKKGK